MLRTDRLAAESFRLANRAMLDQMYQADRVGGGETELDDYRWRPFQLAFLLTVAGPDVRRQIAANRREAAGHAAREIIDLVDVGGLAPGSVTILSPFDLSESSVALTPPHVLSRVRRLDEYSMRGIPGDKVGFARIEEFKGLENEAIVVVDLPAPDCVDRNSAAHYVAMSRARSVLSLIHRKSS